MQLTRSSFFFFFNDTATTEIYTLSLHDALPILFALNAIALGDPARAALGQRADPEVLRQLRHEYALDRKSTRLNSSHGYISYAVFCLKKKKYVIINPCETYAPLLHAVLTHYG